MSETKNYDINLNNTSSHVYKKWINESTKNIYDKMNKLDTIFKCKDIDIMYHKKISNNSEGCQGCQGERGPIGYYGPPGLPSSSGKSEKELIDELPKMPENKMVLHIEFKNGIDIKYREKIKDIINDIKITQPNNPSIKEVKSTLDIIKDRNVYEVKYGIYKKKNFDKILSLMSEVNSYMDNDEFKLMRYGHEYTDYNYEHENREIIICSRTNNSYNINLDFVYNNKYNTDKDCIWTYFKNKVEYTETDKFKLTLNIIVSDIEKNINILENLIYILEFIM